MKVFIKEAVKEDIKEINEMLTELIHDEEQYDENINKDYVVDNYYEKFLDKKDSCIIVAKNNNDDIMGYGFGFITDYGMVYRDKIAQLDAIFIKPEYRKNGIAKNIMQYFTKWAKDNGASYIELKVCSSNNKAINLYESDEFCSKKIIMKKKIENSEELIKTKKNIKKAKEKIDKISQDEHERYLAELREKYIRDQKSIQKYGYECGLKEGRESGLKEGHESGFKDGAKKEKLKIAKTLLEQGINIGVISESTGLSIEELNNLQ